MPKFKVGDEVKILSFEELKEQAYKNEYGNYESLYFPYCTFKLNSVMKNYCGKKAKITEAFIEQECRTKEKIYCYKLDIDQEEWTWIEQWLINP